MKFLKIQLVAIAALLLWAGSAQALCALTGYPVRVTSFEGGTYLYFRTSHTANHYFVGIIRDPFVAATVNKAYTGKTKVFVQTNLGSCPTPVPGQNYIGRITDITLGV